MGAIRFGKKSKLKPRYIGPFEILRKSGKCFLSFGFTPKLSTYSWCLLCVLTKSSQDWQQSCFELRNNEYPIWFKIWRQTSKDCRFKISRVEEQESQISYKVIWQNQDVEEAIWELEEAMIKATQSYSTPIMIPRT